MADTVWFSLCWKVLWLHMDTDAHRCINRITNSIGPPGKQTQNSHLVGVGAEIYFPFLVTHRSLLVIVFQMRCLGSCEKRKQIKEGKIMVFCPCAYAHVDKDIGVCETPLSL